MGLLNEQIVKASGERIEIGVHAHIHPPAFPKLLLGRSVLVW